MQTSQFKRHVRRHWHVHLAHLSLLVLVLVTIFGGGAVTGSLVTRHVLTHQGGAVPTQPSNVYVASGGRVPASVSLVRYAFRIHQQHVSSSCVGQTAALLAEMETYEFRHKKLPMASEFLWTQCNGGADVGITYNCAFDLFTREGQARLGSAYPYDNGSYPSAYPSAAVIKSAWPFRASSWRFVLPSDAYTIMYELAHGRPVALLLKAYDGLYHGTSAWLSSDGGTFYFNHSVVIVAYNRYGVEIQNSWGPAWGNGGRIWLTWGYVARFGLAAVAATLYEPTPKHKPAHKPAPKHKPAPAPSHLQTGGPSHQGSPKRGGVLRHVAYQNGGGARLLAAHKSLVGWYVANLPDNHGRDLAPLLNAAGDQYDIWPVGLAAMVSQESSFVDEASRCVSAADCSFGLTQITVETAGGRPSCIGYLPNGQALCVGDGSVTSANINAVRAWEFNPRNAITAGASYLRDARRLSGVRFPNLYTAYNCGKYQTAYAELHPTGECASDLALYEQKLAVIEAEHLWHPKPKAQPKPVRPSTGGAARRGGGSPSYADNCRLHGTDCRKALLALINVDRAKLGLYPFTLSMTMSQGTRTCIGARGHALHMAQAGAISHDQFPSDVCNRYEYAAENVGASTTTHWQAMVLIHRMMMAEGPCPGACPESEWEAHGHYLNLTSRAFTQVGIDAEKGARGRWYVSEEFAG